jgi:hypothetical protein
MPDIERDLCLAVSASPGRGFRFDHCDECCREITSALFTQCVEQRLGLLDLRCLEALGEPSIHGREEFAGVGMPALVAPEPSETDGSTEFPRLRGLAPGDLDRPLKCCARFVHASMVRQGCQEFASQSIQFGFWPTLSREQDLGIDVILAERLFVLSSRRSRSQAPISMDPSRLCRLRSTRFFSLPENGWEGRGERSPYDYRRRAAPGTSRKWAKLLHWRDERTLTRFVLLLSLT